VLSTSPVMEHYRTIRNKVSAHTEVQHVADKYQRVDIATLGVKWDDLPKILDKMQRLVELLGLLIRNACFAWDMLEAFGLLRSGRRRCRESLALSVAVGDRQQLSPEERQAQRYASGATSRRASRKASMATSRGTQLAIMTP
jgi:hypothetical protein